MGENALGLDLTFEIQRTRSTQKHTIAIEAAVHIPAALRDLAPVQFVAASAIRPIRHQRTMRRPGYRIFRDADFGRKEPRNEVGLITRRSRNYGESIEFCERCKVRVQRCNL